MTFGEKAHALRLKKGMSMDELAERLGYNSRTSIFRLEHNDTDPPLSRAIKIAEILDTTVAYLIGETDDPEGSNLIGKVDNRTVNESVTVDREEH